MEDEGIFKEEQTTVSKTGTAKVYEKALELIEAVEDVLREDGGFTNVKKGDRPLVVASPMFLGMFEQMKHRYRTEMDPATTVLMVATIMRNFANSDGLSELGLAKAVQDFLFSMNAANGMPTQEEVTDE